MVTKTITADDFSRNYNSIIKDDGLPRGSAEYMITYQSLERGEVTLRLRYPLPDDNVQIDRVEHLGRRRNQRARERAIKAAFESAARGKTIAFSAMMWPEQRLNKKACVLSQ